MKRFAAALGFVIALAGALVAPAAHAQGTRSAPPESAQFDFLVGHWELEVVPKVSGLAAMVHGSPRLVGTWKAWRAFDGLGVDDEFRVTDASGNPMALSRTLRVFDPKSRQWLLETLDAYGARFTAGTARWEGGEMRLQGSGVHPDGRPYVSRSRFFEIGPERFRMEQDRSFDNGASWDEGVLKIAAKRVSAKAAR